MNNNARDIYFVGTIPFSHLHEVFFEVAEHIDHSLLKRCPDGELGDRRFWIKSQYPVLAAHPAIEVGEYPSEGVNRKTGYEIQLRLKSTASLSDLDHLEFSYPRYALASYEVFKRMKAAGKVPQHWRFQVNLPSVSDILSLVVEEHRAILEAPLDAAMLRSIDAIQEAIPHSELAITFDIVRGLLIFEEPTNVYFRPWFEPALGGVVQRHLRYCRAVKPDVELGLHLCYGDQDHVHAMQPRNLSACVQLANCLAADLGRKIDYVHMPVPRDRDDAAYFEPLKQLNRSGVKHVYLGLVHYTDGLAGGRKRIASAAKSFPDFGIATECGFGRRPSHQDIRELLKLHIDLAKSTSGVA